ncbi:hypothetical protein ABEB36_013014 [Hypothenemus hampei]|uniref:Tc1-like transposase DDE domain-containing protein n=1 Tax=Hypothenemus hampei TaxID=57062 RepID=A0ABD1E6I8_HYPHA
MQTRNYHGEMNQENFGKWFENQLIPNLHEPSLNGHRVLRLPPYHCQFNAIELIWGICKNYYNAHTGRDGKNIKASLEMWKEALAKVTEETWRKCIEHTDLEITKWYNKEQIMHTADTNPLIINVDDDESDEWASDNNYR